MVAKEPGLLLVSCYCSLIPLLKRPAQNASLQVIAPESSPAGQQSQILNVLS